MKNSVCIIPGAESVFHINDHAPGVLLLHGFSGSPKELILQGEAIIRNGYSVSIPRYPGHGTSLEDMTTTSLHDWYTCAREAYIELSRRAPRIIIAGLSMGGLFALRLAKEFNTEQIILISTPMEISDSRAWLLPLMGIFKTIWWREDPKRGINDPEMRSNHICYWQGIPLRQAAQLIRYIKGTKKLLPFIKARTLIIQSENDEHIDINSAAILRKGLASADIETFMVKMSNHAITADFDRKKISQKIIDFLNIPSDNTF